jgi:hypothetical protein
MDTTQTLNSFYPATGHDVLTRRPRLITIFAILQLCSGLSMTWAAVALANFSRSNRDLGTLTTALAATSAIAAVAMFAAAYGLWTLRPWGRILQIVIALPGLAGFPVGTLVSVAMLAYLFKQGVRVIFSGKTFEQLSLDEVLALHEIDHGTVWITAVLSVSVILLVVVAVAFAVISAVSR